MSGYNNTLVNDSCFERSSNELNDAQYNYAMYVNAVNRQGVSPYTNLTVAQGREYFGPFGTDTVNKESFLQGRGQVLSECPENEVIQLPASRFSDPQAAERPAGYCAPSALERMFTRVPKSANTLSEAEISEFNMFPGAYETGYSGYNSVIQTHQQTRMASFVPPVSSCGKPASYATYGIGEYSGRYGLGARTTRYE